MRTTVNLDEDVALAVRALARAEGKSFGRVVSELARRGLAPREERLGDQGGFPVFRVAPDAPSITPDMVEDALQER